MAVTLVLIVCMTLMAGYLQRSLLFSARSASNQWRATRAFHTAEAGFDWALARINDPTPLGDDCRPSVGGTSFRVRYLQPSVSTDNSNTTGNANKSKFNVAFAPAAMASAPGAVNCVIGAGLLMCNCPAPIAPSSASAPAGLATGLSNFNDDTRFSVGFAAVAGDPRAVTLTAHGCTDPSNSCSSIDDQAPLHAFARVQAIVKLPAFASQPMASSMAVVPGSWHDE